MTLKCDLSHTAPRGPADVCRIAYHGVPVPSTAFHSIFRKLWTNHKKAITKKDSPMCGYQIHTKTKATTGPQDRPPKKSSGAVIPSKVRELLVNGSPARVKCGCTVPDRPELSARVNTVRQLVKKNCLEYHPALQYVNLHQNCTQNGPPDGTHCSTTAPREREK